MFLYVNSEVKEHDLDIKKNNDINFESNQKMHPNIGGNSTNDESYYSEDGDENFSINEETTAHNEGPSKPK